MGIRTTFKNTGFEIRALSSGATQEGKKGAIFKSRRELCS